MIRDIFSSMRHNKARAILILILMSVTYFLSLIVLTNSFSFGTQIRQVRNMFSTDIDRTYRIDVSYIEDFDASGQAFAQLKEYINGLDDAFCGAYDESGEYFDELMENREYIACNEAAYAESFRADTPEIAEVVFFDTEILEILATGLQMDDFKATVQAGEVYLPLYAGSDFEGILSAGDVLTLSRNGAKYIVKGFLNDAEWLDDSDAITMPPVSLNHKFLAPFSEKDESDSISQQSTVGKIFVKSDSDFSSDISDAAMQLGIKIRITSVSDFMEQWKEDNAEILKLNFYLAAIVLVCSLISIISTLCVTVLLRKKEYGIRIAFGTTKRRITESLCGEVLILNIISGAVAFILVFYNYAHETISSYKEIYLKTLCSASLSGLVALIVLLSIMALAVPTSILKMYNPAELVKEEE